MGRWIEFEIGVMGREGKRGEKRREEERRGRGRGNVVLGEQMRKVAKRRTWELKISGDDKWRAGK